MVNSSKKTPWTLRRALIGLLRAAGVLLPFGWIYYQIDVDQLRQALAMTPGWVLWPSLGLPLLPMALQGMRWWILLRTGNSRLSLWKTLEYHFAAAYYGLVLPGATAQEVVRGFMVSRSVDYPIVWGATWVSKILGLLGWMIVGCLGLIQMNSAEIVEIYDLESVMLGGALFLTFVLFASFSKKITRPFRLLLSPLLPQKAIEIISSIRDAVYLFRSQYWALIVSVLVTVCQQYVLVLGTSIVLFAISGQFIFWPITVILALIEIIIVVLPLTPGGIGIREGLMAWMFSYVGVGPEEMSIYIVLSYIGNGSRLAGGIPIALGRIGRPLKLGNG